LPDQIYTRTEVAGLPRRDAPESPSDVRGWDELTPDCPTSRGTSSHRFFVGQSPCGIAAWPSGSWRSQRSGNGRTIHTFIGEKKPDLHPHDCRSGYPLLSGFQNGLGKNTTCCPRDEAAKSRRCYSDAFDVYERLWYHGGIHEVSQGKADTYSVEAENAELRHFIISPPFIHYPVEKFMFLARSNQKSVKKILFLIRSLNIGGAERQLCLLASELQKNNFSTRIVTIYGGGALEKEVEAMGISVTSLRRRNRWDLRFFIKFFLFVKKEKPDIVHSYLQISNIVAALTKMLLPKTKIVWGVRASSIETQQYGLLVQITQKVQDHLSKIPDWIIFNSYAGMKHAIGLGYPKEKSCAIPNGIDTKHFFPDRDSRLKQRQRWKIDTDRKLIGMVARIDPQKDYPNFLNAAALLVKERTDVCFVCVGSGPENLMREYQQMAHKLNLNNFLIWAGEQRDMRSVYNALDILVLSSCYGEGFPNAIGEAMACGIPCVATNVGDTEQLIGPLGEIVPPKEPEALKRAIVALLDRLEKEGHNLKIATRQRVIERFSVANLIFQTIDTLEQICLQETDNKKASKA